MSRKGKMRKSAGERREEALRPSPFLGYNHNILATHFIKCGAFSLAEAELRRAVWLNPFECMFRVNLAWCLCKQGKTEEALACIDEVPDEKMDEDMRRIAGSIRKNVSQEPTGGTSRETASQ